MAHPAHAVEDRVDLLLGQGVHAAELCVEVGGVSRHLGERVVDLVVERHLLVAQVLGGDPEALAERHLPVAVEGAARVHAHRERGDLRVAAPAGGEEVAGRHLDGRCRLAVPVEAQDQVAPRPGRRHPDVLDGALPRDVGHGERGLRLDAHRRRDLPALAEVARGLRPRPLHGHPGLALLPGEALRADRAGLRGGEARQVAEAEAQAVEGGLGEKGRRREQGSEGKR